jgi:hypothetical protein
MTLGSVIMISATSVELVQTANARDTVDLDVHLRESWNPSGYFRSVTTDRCPDDAYVSAGSWGKSRLGE